MKIRAILKSAGCEYVSKPSLRWPARSDNVFPISISDSAHAQVSIPGYAALETLVKTFHLVCGSLAPFVVILVCNLWIIVAIANASKKRTEMGVTKEVAKTHGKETRHLTRMLIFISIVFIVTSLPYRLHDLVLAVPALRAIYDLSDTYWFLRYMTQYYLVIGIWHWNYGINFYLYCLGGGKKYREDVRRLFKCN
jgi:hypothetical protein